MSLSNLFLLFVSNQKRHSVCDYRDVAGDVRVHHDQPVLPGSPDQGGDVPVPGRRSRENYSPSRRHVHTSPAFRSL